MSILDFWGALVDLTGSINRIDRFLSAFPHGGRSGAVYAATKLLRKAYKFARPISTITWAVFFASPR
jgi:hypothetical protein